MKVDWTQVKIFIKPGITDMRKQINGLAIMAKEDIKAEPLSGNLFIFCGKNRILIKILYWDRNGFCLWQKRLEKDKFPWPQNENEATEITQVQFDLLLDGINFWAAHKRLEFTEIN